MPGGTVRTALTALGDDPDRQDADARKPTGPSDRHRLRVGSCRVACRINDGEPVVLVVEVGERRDVHRTAVTPRPASARRAPASAPPQRPPVAQLQAIPSSIAHERDSRPRSRVHVHAYTVLMSENTVTVREARAHLADHINRAEEGVPTVITRNGAPVAAVVPISDFEALEEAADVMLAREAEAVLAEGGTTVTMAELLADLFTEQDGEAA